MIISLLNGAYIWHVLNLIRTESELIMIQLQCFLLRKVSNIDQLSFSMISCYYIIDISYWIKSIQFQQISIAKFAENFMFIKCAYIDISDWLEHDQLRYLAQKEKVLTYKHALSQHIV